MSDLINPFPVIGDELIIGGQPVSQVAAAMGQTPCYLYDQAAITRRISELRAQLPDQIALYYAIKANPFPPVVELLATQVDGFDVASGGELALALATGISPAQIGFAGPAKTDTELQAAVQAGIVIHVESERELTRLHQIGEASGSQPQVALRINPAFSLKAAGMHMGGGPQPFGIDEEQAPAMIAQLAKLNLPLRGLHIYAGSQNLHAEAIIAAQSASFALAQRLMTHATQPLHFLNIGGGFGIPYFAGQQPLDIAPIAAALHEHQAACQAQLGVTKIILELGRYLVGEAGIYVCQVVDRKISRGRTYLLTNGGMHHHLAASGNLGQVIRKNYPVVNAGQVAGGERECVHVVGPLCTPLDVIAEDVTLGKAAVGDWIAVLQSGAYGASASPQHFLSHPPVQEKLIRNK
ncbi:MAG: pyridoxal-dependent decarboxylase, exosortase A system-associated [Pseudomonadota bacterium]